MKLPKFIQMFFSKPKEPSPYNRDTLWGTLDGKKIPIRCLEDTHLANIYHHVHRYGRYDQEFIDFLKEEAKIRKLSEEFMTGAPYPWQDVDGKWKKLDMEKREYVTIGR